MKTSINFKIAVTLSLLFLFITNASANQFLLNSDKYIIDERLQEKIFVIGNELKSKTNVNVYVNVKSSYGINEDLPMKEKFRLIKEQESNLIKNLKDPYVVLLLSLEDKHSNLLFSKNLASIIDKDEILDDYVIPILASKDKNQLYTKASAAVLNGYAQIADIIAEANNTKLESSIGSSGKVTSTVWKVFMYFLVITGLLAYAYAVLIKKK